MEQFSAFVYAALPYALGFIAVVVIAIVILHIIVRSRESKPQQSEKAVITVDRRNNRNTGSRR